MTETVQLSGATIKIGANFCYKFAYRRDLVERLWAQAAYMVSLSNTSVRPICPKVLDITNHGYRMSRCKTVHDIHGHVIDTETQQRLLVAAYQRLQDQVWEKPRINPQDDDWLDHLTSYMKKVFAHSAVAIAKTDRQTIERALPDLALMQFDSVRIHGDATLDNILYGKGPDGNNLLFVSDPLPPDKRIPAARVVDLGKLLQSAHGWEFLKYDGRWAAPSTENIERLLHMIPERERYGAAIWFGIHVARIIPYIGPTKIRLLRPLAKAAAVLIRKYR
jgi:hypothetical protein